MCKLLVDIHRLMKLLNNMSIYMYIYLKEMHNVSSFGSNISPRPRSRPRPIMFLAWDIGGLSA